MLNKYITACKAGSIEWIEKKSKFIGTVIPVLTNDEAEQAILDLKKKYWDATHNCYAYQIGERNEIQRFSDDGEPQGTAGKPILDVLKGQDIKNTLIVVTRYFGGTLLGTGGLVRAYGRSAKMGIESVGLIWRLQMRLIQINVSYSLSGKVQYLLNDKDYTIRESIYTENVTFVVEVPSDEEDYFKQWLIENTNGDIKLLEGEYIHISRPVK